MGQATNDPRRIERKSLLDGKLIVSNNMCFGTKLPEEVHEIEGETVIVVYQQQHLKPSQKML